MVFMSLFAFFPALFETQKQIDEGLNVKSVEDILNLAHEIVEEKALSAPMQHAMVNYQRYPE